MLPIAHFACLFVIIFVAPGNNLLTHHVWEIIRSRHLILESGKHTLTIDATVAIAAESAGPKRTFKRPLNHPFKSR